MKTRFLFIIMMLIFAAIMVMPASAEEVTIDFDGDGLRAGQSIGNAYADLGVTFEGAEVVSTGSGNLGFSPESNVCKINFSPYATSVSVDFEHAFAGNMEGVLVNGQKISDFNWFWQGNTLHIESTTQNPIKSVRLDGIDLPCLGIKIKFDNLSYNQIPEFPTVALPVAALIGMIFIFQRRKD